MEHKTGFIITNAFQIVLDEFKRKTNKIWEDKGLATTTATTFADLANTAVLKVVENIFSNLNRKTIDDAKISDIEAKLFTASDYNRFTIEILCKRSKKRE